MAAPANVPYTGGGIPNYGMPMQATYHSVGGTSIKATFGGKTFGNLQAISVSIAREKVPITTMGSPSPRGFSRGKRAIAGSFVMVMFDSHALLEAFRDSAQTDPKYKFVIGKDERRPALYTHAIQEYSTLAKDFVAVPAQVPGLLQDARLSNVEQGFGTGLDQAWEKSTPWYADQIPPFNVVLVGVSEYGYAVTMSVLGVEILNEGYGISIDDHVSEQQFTYVATEVSPWTRIRGAKFQDGLTYSSPVSK